ncbi:MAG: hypothetical protein UW66_C0018G0003 [Candidatus Moranbacteria bacterium GW2011_GWF1_44_4]|nr:MAG: hypothetical protein UW66_C0018G0003 [Candidatus Moranbacteria bacterium GW2011_GWF1_44_4]
MNKKKEKFYNLCLIGSCPEIKKEENRILLRNSKKPRFVVEFSNKEWKKLKDALKKNAI